MAVLTVLSPPNKTSMPTSSSSSRPIFYNFNNNDCTYCYFLRKNISKWTPFPTISAVTKRKTEAAKSELHSMQSSNSSGSRCSWIKDTSGVHDKITGQRRREGLSLSALPTTLAPVSSVEDLYEFICAGPLLYKVGLNPDKVAESIDKWILCGSHLCRLFKLNELFLTEPQKVRIYHYYIPVFLWCEQEISLHSFKFKDEDDIPPLVIGFSAPQGCGKTTLVFALDFLFQVTGRKTATISIDDFYLTAEGQGKLRESNPGNALLEFRGNAGSHDLALSVETLTALQNLTREGTKMKLPRYDKSAYNGRGDRADPSKWPEVEGPLSAILFEGWMLGFKPVPAEVVSAVDPQLEIVNKNLATYYEAWDKFIKSWIVIKIQDPSYVYQWRLQCISRQKLL